MKKQKPITIPELVRELGTLVVSEVVECDRSLPGKWLHGQRPGWRNMEKLTKLANSKGFSLTPPLGGAR